MTVERFLIAERSGPLRGLAQMPGDKSISHRALILAAMAEGESRIVGLSDSIDVARTLSAIRALGARVTGEPGATLVHGGAWATPDEPIDCGNSGTTARLLIGALAAKGAGATLTGDASLRRRPMSRVAAPLRAMGAAIAGGEALPLTIHSSERLRPIRHVNSPASAQVKSAILLAGLGASGATEILEPFPSRDHTERILPAFGGTVEREEAAGGIAARLSGPCQLSPADIHIPGDFSAAAFPLVAALLIPGSEIRLAGVGLNPLRTGLLETLRAMGAAITVERQRTVNGEPAGDLMARSSSLRCVSVPAERAPSMIDEYPILAIAAACTEGETAMHGLSELRHKESDRLSALAAGLAACGVQARAEGDTLRVTGGPVPGGARIDCEGDHRIAMAFLVLGLVSEAPIHVEGAEMIATSFPGFAALMRGLGARIAAP